MDLKAYMRQAFTIKRLINASKSRIEELQAMAEWARGVGLKVQASRKIDPMGDLIATITDQKECLLRDCSRLMELQREIKDVTELVKRDEYRLILSERYVKLKSWETIATECNYSLTHVMRIHRRAMLELQNAMLGYSKGD